MVDELRNRKHSGKSGGGNPRVKTLESLYHDHADPT
jgi:hypothetical protein